MFTLFGLVNIVYISPIDSNILLGPAAILGMGQLTDSLHSHPYRIVCRKAGAGKI